MYVVFSNILKNKFFALILPISYFVFGLILPISYFVFALILPISTLFFLCYLELLDTVLRYVHLRTLVHIINFINILFVCYNS